MSLLELLDSWFVDQLEGGKADDRKPSDFDLKQLLMGIVVELEHTDDHMKALEVAMDHLSEDGDYYTKLKTIHSDEVDEFGLPR